MAVREQLRGQYFKCRQATINAILENNLDNATMDKASGYLRTTWNEGVVVRGGSWNYKVTISVKAVKAAGDRTALPPAYDNVQQVRAQAAGEIAEPQKGVLKSVFSAAVIRCCFKTCSRIRRPNWTLDKNPLSSPRRA